MGMTDMQKWEVAFKEGVESAGIIEVGPVVEIGYEGKGKCRGCLFAEYDEMYPDNRPGCRLFEYDHVKTCPLPAEDGTEWRLCKVKKEVE